METVGTERFFLRFFLLYTLRGAAADLQNAALLASPRRPEYCMMGSCAGNRRNKIYSYSLLALA